ncbi:MAG TPA: MarR family transcriptional regulator, partial [Bacteroidota bacterium]|nr:MarR family transcriptional regulator [Bacteroidota bacterium]
MSRIPRYGAKTDCALALWVKLARAFATVSKHSQEDIRSYGLTQPQFGVLESLGHLGTITLGDLSRKQLTSCANITLVVDNLEEQGLVERRPCDEDRRVSYVRLTGKGKRLFRRIFPHHARYMSSLLSTLTQEEQLKLGALLKKLGTSLQ